MVYLHHRYYMPASDSCPCASAYAIPCLLCLFRSKVHLYYHPRRRLKLLLPGVVERIGHARQRARLRGWALLDGELG